MIPFKYFRCFQKKNLNLNFVISAVFQNRNLSNQPEINVIKSIVPNIHIPDIFLEDYVWKNLDKWHDKVALECAETGRRYYYSDLYKKSNILANFLHNLSKLNQNDTVAIILPNVPEYPIIALGAIQAGLKVTTVSTVFTSDEIRKQIISSETKLIFTLNEFWPKISRALENDLDIPVIVIMHKQTESVPSKAIRFDEITKGEDDKLLINVRRKTSDVILLPYSSGTTGLPKGVELTNLNIVSNLHQMAQHPFQYIRTAEGIDTVIRIRQF